eukprot:9751244-Alexandrium_andersonii.AAC.1
MGRCVSGQAAHRGNQNGVEGALMSGNQCTQRLSVKRDAAVSGAFKSFHALSGVSSRRLKTPESG